MKHAPNTPTATSLAARPRNGLTAGLDWAKDDHVICVVDSDGAVVARFDVAHTATGLRSVMTRLNRLGCTEIAIERPDGPVVDALLEAELTVVVISPNQLKNLRSRYGSAGNKDDRFDAYVLADTLRTDRRRLRALMPDSPATVTLRATCRARKDLVNTRVAVANQLRAHLQNAFPAGAVLFAEVDSAINLSFLRRFTHQGLADWLSPKRLGHWLQAVGYCGRTTPEQLHARLLAAPRGTTDDQALARAHITLAYVATLTTLKEQIACLDAQIREQPCGAHGCSPRSATAAPASPPPKPWPAWPASRPALAPPARADRSPSAGPATSNCATPSPTSPATADAPTPGPTSSTDRPSPADTTTPTPPES